MDKKIRSLKRNKISATILIVVLIVGIFGLFSILGNSKNININKIVSRVSSLNADVSGASSEVNTASSYDEITYKFNIEKETSDEAVITGTLTDAESKYARFKEISSAEITDNGKKIVLRTTSSKPKIILSITNAPYGETFNPKFTINSENPDNKNIITDPVTISSPSIEGTVKDEKNNIISGVELSLNNADGEIKRTYNDDNGFYVFSLPKEDNYLVKVEEEKYELVRYEELTTNENKKILNIIVKEVTPFTLDLKKTIVKLDLTLDGKKETFTYNDETKVIKNIKKANTIEGSIYYNIYAKNIGDIKGTLTQIKDIIHDGLSFDETKNPGWELIDNNLYYTVLEGKDIDPSETVTIPLVLDIVKTNEAKNYINEVIGSAENYKNITYIINNNVYKEEYVIEGEKISEITPSVENFGGWYTDRNYTNKYDFNKEVNKNLILYGKINNNKYNITFIDKNPSNDEETIIETKTVDEGLNVEFPTNIPEHLGYTFKCWTLNNECIGELESREDSTLYTSYTVNKYNITYDLDGATLEEENPSTYTVKDEVTLNNPSKEGYTFLGWTGSNGDTKELNVTIAKGSTGDKFYKANFEINKSTLTIRPRGGSYEDNYGDVTFTENYGTIKTISPSVRRGYNFIRYQKIGGGTYLNNVFTFDNDDAELNAVYEIINYNITYKNITEEEKEALNNPISYTVESDTFTLNNPENRKDIDGYNSEDFLGWDDGSGNVSKTITIENGSIGDKEYTAVWKENEDDYGITYELHDGILSSPNPNTYKRGTNTFTLNNPSKEGYTFTGWSGTGIDTVSTEVTITKGSVGDRSYEANYSANTYNITYEGLTNEEIIALNNPSTYTIESDEISLNNPTREGYTFIGWSGTDITDKSLNVKIPTGSIGDRTYTANFEEIGYNITYNLNGGTVSPNNKTSYNINTDSFTLNNPTKAGYTFTGWSGTDLEGNDNLEVTITKGSIGNRSYEAHYTPIIYNITYDYDGGSLEEGKTNPSTYTIESETITFNNPSKTGYTFRNYTDNDVIISEIPTGSTGNKNLKANYDINRFNVYYYNGEELFASEIVDYNKKATIPVDTPTKAHNIFLYWADTNNNEYNFDTLITEDKTLHAVYEEVEAPTITLNPVLDAETNKTWACDNNSDETCGVLVTITPAKEGYETYYKVGSNEYTLYTEPFKVYNNETISAFSKKSNINSIETSKDVNNIDKINPTIIEDSFTTKVASFSVTINGKIKDNESGIKNYELFIVERGSTLDESNPYTTSETYSGNHDDVDVDFKFTGLDNLTDYDIYVKAYDYVNNSSIYKIEATTIDYIARIIGRSNTLYDNPTQWEKFESVQDAIDSCEKIQCTIQINPSIVNESIEIKDGQDITFDIDSKELTSTNDYTVLIDENAKFTLLDNSLDHNGKISNTYSKAIINKGTFTLGEGSTEETTEIITPQNFPIVEGISIGLDNYGIFYYFDGHVKSMIGDGYSAVVENDNSDSITQYPYNIIVLSNSAENKVITYLKYIEDPEARIKSVYYSKLSATEGVDAISSSNNGSYNKDNVKLLSQIKQYGDYGFVYNPAEDSIINGNNIANTSTAISYVKVDLTGYTENQYLLLNTSCDTINSDNYGYIAVSETFGDLSNKVLTISGNDNSSYRIINLEPNKTYYIYFGFVKNSNYVESEQYFKVNSAEIINKDTPITNFELLHDGKYYFEKQADGSYVNNENKTNGLSIDSYAVFDLTNLNEDLNIIVEYDIDSYPDQSNIGYIDLTDNEFAIAYNDYSNRILTVNDKQTDKAISITIPHGEKKYLHFGFNKRDNTSSYNHIFKIKKITLQKLSSKEDVSNDNIYFNSDIYDEQEIISDGDDYIFRYTDTNPFIWKDSSGNGHDASVYNASLSDNKTYYSFNGSDSYTLINSSNISLDNYEESVYLEYSTISNNNSILYFGSNKEKLALGKYGNYLIVSNTDTVNTFNLPDNYSDGEKHNFLVTYKDSEYKLYFDGEKLEETTSRDYWGNASDGIYIGTRNGGSYWYNGNIYQVRIFDKEITPEDVSNEDNLIVNLNPTLQGGEHYYINTNRYVRGSLAHGYMKYDLTNVNEDKYLKINYSINSRWNFYGAIIITDSAATPSINTTQGRALYTSGVHENQDLTIKLHKNKVNYVHYLYRNENNNPDSLDYFLINSVKLYEDYSSAELDGATTISRENVKEGIFNLPIARVNEDPSAVVMLKDINLTSQIKIPEEKEVILDLNGHTLTSSISDYAINNSGNLTITDGKYSEAAIAMNEAYEDELIINEERKAEYERDLEEYQEYAGLCEGCEPSEEYIFDQSLNKVFKYTGDYVKYQIPYTGTYKFQVWGAQGGYRTTEANGGKGGYSEGVVELTEGETVYVYVGGSGNTGGPDGGFNGGGSKTTYPGGGGATDIRVEGNTLYNRIIVAGGGGSDGAASYPGKAGGGLAGITATETGYCSGGEGGTQTSAGTRGSFGEGGSGGYVNAGWGGGGFGGAGGGGWYGGGGVNPDRSDDDRGGGGGSGFVYDGTNEVPEGYLVTNHVLTNSFTLDGTSTNIPSYDGTSTMTGNSGDGYAIISFIDEEKIEEIRESITKTYNVKEEPEIDYREYNSGKEILHLNSKNFEINKNIDNNIAEINPEYLYFESNTNGMSEIYFKRKVTKTAVAGKVRTWNNSTRSSGTLYIGFATTPDLTTNDFVNYKTFNLNLDSGQIDFNVKYDGEDEVYFKIIHEHKSGEYLTYSKLSDLTFNTYDIVSNYSGSLGNITSASNNIFLNNTGANLTIEDGVININKNNSSAIINRGNLTIGEAATINVNSASSNGIYNETTGNILASSGKIKVIGSSSIGLNNTSTDDLIEDLDIETSTANSTALYTRGIVPITFNNLKLYGSGTGFYDVNDNDLILNNSVISSTGNDAINIVRNTGQETFTINSSSIYSRINANYSYKNLVINNSNLLGNRNNIYSYYGKVTINDSYLENLTTNITNNGLLYINNSTINGNERLLNNLGSSVYDDFGYQEASYAYIKDSILNLHNGGNSPIAISNAGVLELENTTITSDSGYGEILAVNNIDPGYLVIRGNSSINGNFYNAINNTGYVKLGSEYTGKDVYNFDYTGSVQKFVVPKSGKYKIEAWGASGSYKVIETFSGEAHPIGGNGAYTAGDIELTEGETLYIYVGSQAISDYNISQYWNLPNYYGLLGSFYNGANYRGGGSTDISISGEENVSNFENEIITNTRSESSYLDRIMVAGAGASTNGSDKSFAAGQALSNPSGTVSQVTGYKFGYGFAGGLRDNMGGAGYFGGTSAEGGTSYISGYLGAVAMDGSSSNPKCSMEDASNDITCSYHNSGKIFTNTVMIPGYSEMPTHTSDGVMKGNLGNGFARITYLDDLNNDTVTNEPSINASNYAITGSGRLEYLDGTLSATKAINGDIERVPGNHDIKINISDNKETMNLKDMSSEPYVARINDTNYTSLKGAIESATDGDEIVILDDIDEAYSFTIDKEITINYNGHYINSYNKDYLFINNSNFRIHDDSNNAVYSYYYGDGFVLNNGNLTLEDIMMHDTDTTKYLINNNSVITMNNITEYTSHNQAASFILNNENASITINSSNLNETHGDFKGKYIDNFGVLNINDSSYILFNEGFNTSTSNGSFFNENTGTLNIDNVNFRYDTNRNAMIVNNKNITNIKNSNSNTNSEMNIYSTTGTITLENNTFTLGTITNSGDSLLNIKSGTYSNTINVSGTGHKIDETDNLYSFIMDDGTISSTLNLNSDGIKWIKGGSIITTNNYAVNNTTSSKLILGINDGIVENKDLTKPIITASKSAINTSNYEFEIDFYDGILTGEEEPNTLFETTELGYQVHKEQSDNKVIEYLVHEPMFKNANTSAEYYSTNEVNEAINNGTFNSNDTLQAINDLTILELHEPITVPNDFIINFDLNNHLIEQDNENLFVNNGTLVIDDSKYQEDNNNGYGKIEAKLGEIIVNNGTLTINSGELENERHNIESTVILNNGTLTINDGTFTKYHDEVGYVQRAAGSVIENNGVANIVGGQFKVGSSYAETYNTRVGNSSDYIKNATIFKNNENGELIVTGGSFDGITEYTWVDGSGFRTDYYYENKGELINNYGLANIKDITSNNTHIGVNEGTLTLDNVTMNKIMYINNAKHPNLINTGNLTITNSHFETHSSFVNNTGNIDISNTYIEKFDDIATFYRYSDGYVRYNNLYRDSNDDSWSGYKNSFVIRNDYNSDNSNTINIMNSEIYNRGSGEVIENTGNMVIDNSKLESSNNNTINNNKVLTISNESDIKSNTNVAINNSSNAVLNLGISNTIDSEVSKTSPLVTGYTYGINNSGIFNFLDGYIKGKTKAVYGAITTNEIGYNVVIPSDKIDEYYVSYLDKVKVIKNLSIDTSYYSISDAISEASSGDTLQMISNYNVLNTDNTIIFDKDLVLDLNGYHINQGNDILFRNEKSLIINDSNSSGNNQGGITITNGSEVIDNFGDLTINSGTFNTSSRRLVIKNEGLTDEEKNQGKEKHSVTLQNAVKIIASDETTVIDNSGRLDILNGAYIENTADINYLIINREDMNIIDLNKDDDENTSSTLTAPWIYSKGNNIYRQSSDYHRIAAIYNMSGANLNIYGGLYNNGGTYDSGSIEPDYIKIINNDGTAYVKNLDNYSYALGSSYGSLTIENSHFYNGCASTVLGNNIIIKDTIFELNDLPNVNSGIRLWLSNSTLDNVTILSRDNQGFNNIYIMSNGNTTIKNSSINLKNSNDSNAIYMGGNNNKIENTNITLTNTLGNAGTLDIINSNINVTNKDAINNSGTLNIYNNVNITSLTNSGIVNNSSGTIYLGTEDGIVSTTDPVIEGLTYGIDNISNGTFAMFDGIIIGSSAPSAVNGTISSYETGYTSNNISPTTDYPKYRTTLKVNSSSTVPIAKVGRLVFSSQDEPLVTATNALQSAINSAVNSGKAVDLLIDITIDENISASSNVDVYTNGHSVTYASGVTASNITFKDGAAPTASLGRLLSDITNAGSEDNNVVIIEMDDGTSLDVTKTYELYLDNNLVSLEENEIGDYNYKGNISTLKPIKGRIYLNNLTNGNYKLKSSDNKEANFSIDEEGKIIGNAKKYDKQDSSINRKVATSLAELIIAIQTGMIKINYIFIIIPIVILIIILLLVAKRNKKVSN